MKDFLKNKAIKEFMSSEEIYSKSLMILTNLLKDEKLLDNNLSLKQLVPLIKLLKQISDELIKNVTNSINNNDDNSRVMYQRRRVHLLSDFFDAYLRYTKTYEKFMKENKDNKSLFATCTKVLAEQFDMTLGFNDLLIQPIQRGPRYNLLIKEAIVHSMTLNEQNSGELQELKQKIEQFLTDINTLLKQPPPSSNTEDAGYQFGDLSRAAWRRTTSFFAPPLQHDGYQFGDVTRGILSGQAFANFWPDSAAIAKELNEDDFFIIDGDSDPDVSPSP